MGRVSQAQAEQNRRHVVETASRLFRERGAQISVADLMNAAGLTHGGFYKQFASKEALFDEAAAHALAELGGSTATPDALIDAYLSVAHRDDMAGGCPVAAFAVDIARGEGGAGARDAYSEGVTRFAQRLATDEEDDGLARLCTLVGALVLARATKGAGVSEEILEAGRRGLEG